ncbi:hypothetical protein OG596_07080 [Streptomyces sp. NBC_01102]|uniref:hypothetical protein n=1 Tax=Streptomyces sp. NBC_01102 TaxID=2903749 RepID=UPI0038630266|nr:hypothetical protein OG596_07080 [Streptomyces sp. NBC_01102]
MASGTDTGLAADAAALAITKAVTTRRPRTRCTAGRDAALIMRLGPLLPDRTLDRILGADLRRHYPKGATAAASPDRRVEEARSQDLSGSPVPQHARPRTSGREQAVSYPGE